MTSGQEPLSFGAVNSNLPPLCNTPATFLINPSWTSGSSKKKSPQATTPSKVRAKKSESSTAAHSTGTLGKRARNAATIVGEASTPYTLNPRSIKTCEIGTPVLHPRSRTVPPPGNVWDQPATTDAPTPELFLPRLVMNTDATSS